MKIYITKGRCAYCLNSKKVVKLGQLDAHRGLCRTCMKKLAEDPALN